LTALFESTGVSVGTQQALATKANTSHSHVIADISGLQTSLNGKAASNHVHAISDVAGLQSILDGLGSTLSIGVDLMHTPYSAPTGLSFQWSSDLVGWWPRTSGNLSVVTLKRDPDSIGTVCQFAHDNSGVWQYRLGASGSTWGPWQPLYVAVGHPYYSVIPTAYANNNSYYYTNTTTSVNSGSLLHRGILTLKSGERRYVQLGCVVDGDGSSAINYEMLYRFVNSSGTAVSIGVSNVQLGAGSGWSAGATTMTYTGVFNDAFANGDFQLPSFTFVFHNDTSATVYLASRFKYLSFSSKSGGDYGVTRRCTLIRHTATSYTYEPPFVYSPAVLSEV